MLQQNMKNVSKIKIIRNHYNLSNIFYVVSPRTRDYMRTPPIFSRHEDATQHVYAAEDFGLTEEEKWQPGNEFFAGMTG